MPIKNVLVVDDSRSARLMLRKLLQGADLDADLAESAEEALEYLRTRHPDAIFIDHTMPGMDGVEAIRAIKNNPDTAPIPIAMYTSKEGGAYAEEVRASGAVGILSKPATPDSLARILQALNEEFDHASARIEAVRAQPAAVTPLPVKGSVEAIEDIARTAAEAVADEAIRARLVPRLEERLAGLKEDVLAGNTATFTAVAERICETRTQALSSRLSQHLDAELKKLKVRLDTPDPALLEAIDAAARAAASRHFEEAKEDLVQTLILPQVREQLAALKEELAWHSERAGAQAAVKALQAHAAGLGERIETRLAELRTQAQGELDERQVEKLRALVRASAAEQAAAQEAARQAAREADERFGATAAALRRSLARRTYALAALTAAVGLLAAFAVYYFHLR